MIDKNFQMIRELEWEEVFLSWYKSEGKNSHWIETAKKYGFASWETWRLSLCVNNLKCRETKWGLYKSSDIKEVITQLFGAPYRTFMDRYCGSERVGKICQLINNPEVGKNDFIKRLVDNFLEDETIICMKVDGNLYVIEGMHRCCALAIMIDQGKELPKKIRFAIGISPLEELPVI